MILTSNQSFGAWGVRKRVAHTAFPPIISATTIRAQGLERLWVAPRKPYENYSLRLSVTLEKEPSMTFSREYQTKAPVRGKDTHARAVVDLAAAIHAQFKEDLTDTHVIVSVAGRELERAKGPKK